jgi:hypothetical protein
MIRKYLASSLGLQLRYALGHVEEELGAHRLEAGARERIVQVLSVDFDGAPDLLFRQRISQVMD